MEAVAAGKEAPGGGDDPVVAEVDVYLAKALARRLYLLQYPLRPAHLPYASSAVEGVRVRSDGEGGEGGKLEVDLCIERRGENYSSSRGEQYAKMVELGRTDGERVYQSGMLDQITLTSDTPSQEATRYTAGVFKDGELHLTPLRGIFQLRPSLSYLDQADAASKKLSGGVGGGGGVASEGETTGSEGEEAKPVQVRFARRDLGNQQSSRKPSFQQWEQQKRDGSWSTISYHSIESTQADEGRRLLFAPEEDRLSIFAMAQQDYLDLVCPPADSRGQSDSDTPTLGPTSLSRIRQLPLPQRVREMLRVAVVMTFDHLCSVVGEGVREEVLELCEGCGVLVQGCWCVASEVLYPSRDARAPARDYVLWCFSQGQSVLRSNIMAATQLSNEEVVDILCPLATRRKGQGWRFALPTDDSFLSHHRDIAHRQQQKWQQKHKELSLIFEQRKPPGNSHTEQLK